VRARERARKSERRRKSERATSGRCEEGRTSDRERRAERGRQQAGRHAVSVVSFSFFLLSFSLFLVLVISRSYLRAHGEKYSILGIGRGCLFEPRKFREKIAPPTFPPPGFFFASAREGGENDARTEISLFLPLSSLSLSLSLSLSRVTFLSPRRLVARKATTCSVSRRVASRRAGRRRMKTVSGDFTKYLLLRRRDRAARPRLAMHEPYSFSAIISATRNRDERMRDRFMRAYLSTCLRESERRLSSRFSSPLFQTLFFFLFLARSARVHALDTRANGETNAFFYRSSHLAFPQSAAKRHCERSSSFVRSSSQFFVRVTVYIRWDLHDGDLSNSLKQRFKMSEGSLGDFTNFKTETVSCTCLSPKDSRKQMTGPKVCSK